MQDCWDRRHAAELELKRLHEEVLDDAKVGQLCILGTLIYMHACCCYRQTPTVK